MCNSLREKYNEQYRQGHFTHDQPSDDVRALERQLLPRSLVLDVGCGAGADCGFLAAQGHRVCGIDLSDAAINLACAKWKDYDIDFRQGQAEVLPYPDARFDAVFSMGVLQRTNLEQSLPEIARVLKSESLFLTFFFLEVTFEGQPERDFRLDSAKAFDLINSLFIELDRKHSCFPGDDGEGQHWHKAVTLNLKKRN